MHADIVIPLHDPAGLVLPHLKTVTPTLETYFGRALACTTTQTREQQPDLLDWFLDHPFYQLLHLEEQLEIGEQFRALYRYAANLGAPETILHLAFPDRLVYALLAGGHRQEYLTDIDAITPADLPLLFHRSEAAWATHPTAYRELENMTTRVGEMLFKRKLDFGWCYMALRAGQLGEVIESSYTTGLSVLAEILLPLRDEVKVKEVDWLAWEDPFITGREPQELISERNNSIADHLKRLSYVVPILDLLAQTINKDNE